MNYRDALRTCLRRACETGEDRYLIQIDDSMGEGRGYYCASETYVESAEFEVFEGRIIEVVSPEGVSRE